MEVTRRGLPPLASLPGVADGRHEPGLDDWLDAEDIPDVTPFLISPELEYDVDLNGYFLRPALAGAPGNTRLAAARDISRFLDFLSRCRGGCGWRDAVKADWEAYWYWRHRDPAGSRVAGSRWNRELSMLSRVYAWAARQGLVA